VSFPNQPSLASRNIDGGSNMAFTNRLTVGQQNIQFVDKGTITLPTIGYYPTDADFNNPVDGMMVVNLQSNSLCIRMNGTWKSSPAFT